MGRVSQTWPLKEAIVSAVEASASLQALLAPPGIYSLEPSEGTPYPYITFGLTTETDDDMFNADGTLASVQLDVWTLLESPLDDGSFEVSSRLAEQIYGELRQLLHKRPLAVAGFRMVMGTITLVATLLDPDGEHVHAIVRYDVTQREAA
jgi:hypothetical protein